MLALLVQGMGFGWRMAFVIPSIVCLLWLAPWLATFPDKPRMAAIALKPAGAAAGRFRVHRPRRARRES